MPRRGRNHKRPLNLSHPSPEVVKAVRTSPPIPSGMSLQDIESIIGSNSQTGTELSPTPINSEDQSHSLETGGAPGQTADSQTEEVPEERRFSQPEEAESGNTLSRKAEILKQVRNRYGEGAPPPYVVYIHDRDISRNLGNYHTIILGRTLRTLGIQIKSINRAGLEKIVLQFDSGEQANNFIEDGISRVNRDWIAFVPNSCIYPVGIVHRLPEELNEQDIWDGLDEESKRGLLKIEFMRRKTVYVLNGKEQIEYANSGSLKVFAKFELPSGICVYGEHCLVEKFVTKVKRCYRCQRYGHFHTSCNHPMRCERCGDSHRPDECNRRIRCVNCGEAHYAYDRRCIVYEFNSELLALRSLLGNSPKEAEYMMQVQFRAKYNIDIKDSKVCARREGSTNHVGPLGAEAVTPRQHSTPTSRIREDRQIPAQETQALETTPTREQGGGENRSNHTTLEDKIRTEESRRNNLRLGENLMEKLNEKVENQLNDGARLVSSLKSIEAITLYEVLENSQTEKGSKEGSPSADLPPTQK